MMQKPRGKTQITSALMAGILCTIISACKSEMKPMSHPVESANVVEAIQQDIPHFLEYPANTASVESIDIVARTRGFIEAIHFTDGQIVKSGQLLYTIELIYDEAKLEQAKAELEIAHAKVKRTRLSYERQERLLKQKLTSKEERDKARLSFNAALAEKKRAAALVGQASQELSYTQIKSPIDGRISRTQYYPGELVDPDDRSGSTTLTSVVKLSPLYVNFPVPSNDLQTLLLAQRQHGQHLLVRFTLLGDIPISTYGSLDFINNAANTETGTIFLRATVSNLDQHLLPGQFGHALVQIDINRNAVLIPAHTIHEDFNGFYVYIIDDSNRLQRKNIKKHQTIDGWVQVEGLPAKAKILSGGLAIVHPGLAVKPIIITPPIKPMAATPSRRPHRPEEKKS